MITLTLRRFVVAAALAIGFGLVLNLSKLFCWTPGNRAGFWVLAVTAAAALLYAWLTYLLLRRQHTPVLVGAYENSRTVIRNFGLGAALNVCLMTDKGTKLARTSDLPPGGSADVNQKIDWTIVEARYIFYQDIVGRWYGTKCLGQGISPAANIPVTNVFLGRVFNPPTDARRAALTRSVADYWVQVNRSWDPRNWIRQASYVLKKRRAETRLVKMIRSAIATGLLDQAFTPAEVSAATDLDKVIVDRFLPNHLVGNTARERELFIRDPTGRFRLK